jgi:pSer/pThr/pTyr-binding forkhead associated (FHA) protein
MWLSDEAVEQRVRRCRGTRQEAPQSGERPAVILRFPWGQEITVADRLRIGRFDWDNPSLISDWDPVSQELAKRLANPRNGDKPLYSAISRKHAEIYLEGDKVLIVDSGSKFGTRLSGGGFPEIALAPDAPSELAAGRRIDLDREHPALTIEVVEIRGAQPAARPQDFTTRV